MLKLGDSLHTGCKANCSGVLDLCFIYMVIDKVAEKMSKIAIFVQFPWLTSVKLVYMYGLLNPIYFPIFASRFYWSMFRALRKRNRLSVYFSVSKVLMTDWFFQSTLVVRGKEITPATWSPLWSCSILPTKIFSSKTHFFLLSSGCPFIQWTKTCLEAFLS